MWLPSSSPASTSTPLSHPPDRFVWPRAPIERAVRGELLPVGADLGQGRVELHLVVERDERETVGRREALDQERGAPTGDVELLPRHRAGAVEHEGECERPALGRDGRCGSGELEHAGDGVLLLDGEQLVVEAHAGTEVHRGWTPSSRDAAGPGSERCLGVSLPT